MLEHSVNGCDQAEAPKGPHGLPKGIKVGGTVYQVVYDRLAILEADPDAAATCSADKLTITLDPTTAEGRTREHVLHEVLHAVFHQAGYRCHLEERPWTIEGMVRVTSNGLLSVLFDNPDLAAYLSPYLREQVDAQQLRIHQQSNRVRELEEGIEQLHSRFEQLQEVHAEEMRLLTEQHATAQAAEPGPIIHCEGVECGGEGQECPACGWPGEGSDLRIAPGNKCPECGAFVLELANPASDIPPDVAVVMEQLRGGRVYGQ